jgi:hypothetical protein
MRLVRCTSRYRTGRVGASAVDGSGVRAQTGGGFLELADLLGELVDAGGAGFGEVPDALDLGGHVLRRIGQG